MSTPDWGIGQYETTAAQLEPAAEVVVGAAAPRPGETLVDVGCGTGNAALLAAARGAAVIGVDPAARLLEVARSRAGTAGFGDARFVLGAGEAIPLRDGVADAVVSVFGVIFAPDAAAAAAEMARVTADGGRIVLSAWIPGGTIGDSVAVFRRAIAEVLGTPPGPPPFPWHEAGALADLFVPLGHGVSVTEHELRFTGASPEAYAEAEYAHHPLALAGAAVLGPAGRLDAARAESLAVLVAGNEDPAAFAATSRYVVAHVS